MTSSLQFSSLGSIERQISSCQTEFAHSSLEATRVNLIGIQDRLEKLGQNLPSGQEICSRYKLLQDDAECLEIRVQIAARKSQPKISPYLRVPADPHMAAKEGIAFYESAKNLQPVKFDVNRSSSDRAIFEDIFQTQGFEGACIGESHFQTVAKSLIFDNLSILKELGITTIFMEAFLYEDQVHLDHYFKHGIISPYLQNYMDKKNAKWPGSNLHEHLAKAKEAGIRIVGIDTSALKTKSSSHFKSAGPGKYVLRRLGLHLFIKNVIAHEKGKGKFVTLTGEFHGTQVLGEFYKQTPSPPGISEILQCPFIDVHEKASKKTMWNCANVLSFNDLSLRHVHLLLERPSKKPLRGVKPKLPQKRIPERTL